MPDKELARDARAPVTRVDLDIVSVVLVVFAMILMNDMVSRIHTLC